jgi:hypothetical protein
VTRSIGARAYELLQALPLDIGRRWGDVAAPFQVRDAKAALMGSALYAFFTRSRGSSKTTDMAACALATILAAAANGRYYWLAADKGQGMLAIDVIAGIISRTPGLGGTIEVQTYKVVNLRTGTTLEVLAADAPGAWGLNPDGVFVDEFGNWADTPTARRLWEAASSAAAKRPGCRLAVFTTAGYPRHFSYAVLEFARASDMWVVHEVAGPSPWIDPAKLEEQRLRLPAAVYAQLWMNEWVEAAGAFLDPAVVDAAFSLAGPEFEAEAGRTGYSAGLDLGISNDRTVLAITHQRTADETRLDRMMVWEPGKDTPVKLGEVEAFTIAAFERFGFVLELDPWQTKGMAERFRAHGIPVHEYNFNTGSKQRLAATLLHALNGGHLRLYDAPGLKDELLGLRVKQTRAGAWTFDHESTGHDDRATALSLALLASIEASPADAFSISAIEDTGPRLIERGGLHKVGDRFLDVGDDGHLHPPPGWREVDPR